LKIHQRDSHRDGLTNGIGKVGQDKARPFVIHDSRPGDKAQRVTKGSGKLVHVGMIPKDLLAATIINLWAESLSQEISNSLVRTTNTGKGLDRPSFPTGKGESTGVKHDGNKTDSERNQLMRPKRGKGIRRNSKLEKLFLQKFSRSNQRPKQAAKSPGNKA
jgi:hypothetical protein